MLSMIQLYINEKITKDTLFYVFDLYKHSITIKELVDTIDEDDFRNPYFNHVISYLIFLLIDTNDKLLDDLSQYIVRQTLAVMKNGSAPEIVYNKIKSHMIDENGYRVSDCSYKYKEPIGFISLFTTDV